MTRDPSGAVVRIPAATALRNHDYGGKKKERILPSPLHQRNHNRQDFLNSEGLVAS